MKIAIIILLILGVFNWTINGEEQPHIHSFINILALIGFIIYSR